MSEEGFQLIRMTMDSLSELYSKLKGKADVTGETGEFLDFYKNWGKSIIYKIPSGYLRFVRYPNLGRTVVHGLFFGNPYKDSKIITNVLDYYLEKFPEVEELEAHIKDEFRGVIKFTNTFATSSEHHDGKWIFYYRRK